MSMAAIVSIASMVLAGYLATLIYKYLLKTKGVKSEENSYDSNSK